MADLTNDQKWMTKALKLAQKAQGRGEVPVAALVVDETGLVSYAINSRERHTTPLGHAELYALHKASQKKKSWRLNDCTLYVTLEPCIMCAGALQQARIKRVVYGASDQKAGGVKSLYQILNDPRLNHQTEVTADVLATECESLLHNFFAEKRADKKNLQSQKVFRERTSVIVVHRNKILGFHAIDPHSQRPYFFIPGGAIESNESPAQAAERECFEETGYRVQVIESTAFEKKYDFHWNGIDHSCRTIFYVAELKDAWQAPQKIEDASYHKGVEWLDIKLVPQIFSYNSEILWAVQKLLKTALKRSALR